MKKNQILFLFIIALSVVIGCQSDEQEILSNSYSAEELNILNASLNLPNTTLDYSFGNDFTKEEINHKGTLGRVLFYDTELSADGLVSCASCHQQSKAFADDLSFSKGANGNLTTRNSIALGSLRSFGAHYDKNLHDEDTPGLFWDERVGSIKEQLKQTINNPNEMGVDLSEITERVNSTNYYRILNKKAFQTETITDDQILEAFEIFINSINSVNSKLETEIISKLNYITGDWVTGELENQVGMDLFMKNCISCHGHSVQLEDNLNPEAFVFTANNGLSLTQEDWGVYQHTQDQNDIGKFKVPGLRNIDLTAPYMHDGRFETLEEVVDFYSSDIQNHPNLHPQLKNGDDAISLNLTSEEKTALVDFLKSLTDVQMTTEEKWSNPFES